MWGGNLTLICKRQWITDFGRSSWSLAGYTSSKIRHLSTRYKQQHLWCSDGGLNPVALDGATAKVSIDRECFDIKLHNKMNLNIKVHLSFNPAIFS